MTQKKKAGTSKKKAGTSKASATTAKVARSSKRGSKPGEHRAENACRETSIAGSAASWSRGDGARSE